MRDYIFHYGVGMSECKECLVTDAKRYLNTAEYGLICIKCYKKHEREQDSEKLKASKHRHYEQHREEYLLRGKAYREQNAEEQKQYHAEYRETHAAKIKAYKKAWYIANKESASEKAHARYLKHRDTILAEKKIRADQAKKLPIENCEDSVVAADLGDVFSHIKKED